MGFFARLFGLKPQIIDHRNMNEDWRVGDLAECIEADWKFETSFNPEVGDVLRVAEVLEGVTTSGRYLIMALSFVGKPTNFSWETTRFRKLRPVHRACDDNFAEQIKRLGRVDVYEVQDG